MIKLMMKLTILSYGDYPALSRWAINVTMKVFQSGKGRQKKRVRERGNYGRKGRRDATLLALEMGEGAARR